MRGDFDADWYRRQLPVGSEPKDAAVHFERWGSPRDLSPHPLFDPVWYKAAYPSATAATSAFAHYLTVGAAAGHRPHPLFDAEYYLEKFPQAPEHPGGLLGHYLTVGSVEGVHTNDWIRPARYRPGRAVGDEHDTTLIDIVRQAPMPSAVAGPERQFPTVHGERGWEDARSRPDRIGLTSIVVGSRAGLGWTERCVASIGGTVPLSDGDVELVIVDRSETRYRAYRATLLEAAWPRTRVIHLPPSDSNTVSSINAGIMAAAGDVVVCIDPSLVVLPGWLEPLEHAVRTERATAAQPKILGAAGWTVSTGVREAGGQPFPELAGLAEHDGTVEAAGGRAGLSHLCLAARRSDLVALRGFDSRLSDLAADLDMSARLHSARSGPLRYVPSSTVVQVLENPRDVAEEGIAKRSATTRDSDAEATLRAHGLEQTGTTTVQPRPGIGSTQPVLARTTARPWRWAIKIATPSIEVRESWGDWHFALALRDALRERGHHAVVDLHGAWCRPTAELDDIVVVLRGLRRYEPNPAHVNLLWVISHPDLVTADELRSFDHRFVASTVLAESLTASAGVEVDPLLQCTDPRRFFAPATSGSGDGQRIDPHADDVIFVGNSRGVARPVVLGAVEAGLPVTVFGKDWAGLIPSEVVGGTYLPNERLGDAYRNAGVVLCDHWDDMRRQGLLSNRLFDAAACGVPIVSDHVQGIEAVFGGMIHTFNTGSEVEARVRAALDGRSETLDQRLELARHVKEEHSFLARAEKLEKAARQLMAQRPRVR